jgi:hypothetical protein
LQHIVDRNPHWPDRSTIFLWRRIHVEFAHRYTKAKEDQTEVCVEYMQELMNEPHKYIAEDGQQRTDVPLMRLKMDAIKWQAAKLKPKKYGDIKALEVINSELDDDIKKRYADVKKENNHND